MHWLARSKETPWQSRSWIWCWFFGPWNFSLKTASAPIVWNMLSGKFSILGFCVFIWLSNFTCDYLVCTMFVCVSFCTTYSTSCCTNPGNLTLCVHVCACVCMCVSSDPVLWWWITETHWSCLLPFWSSFSFGSMEQCSALFRRMGNVGTIVCVCVCVCASTYTHMHAHILSAAAHTLKTKPNKQISDAEQPAAWVRYAGLTFELPIFWSLNTHETPDNSYSTMLFLL